MSIKKELLGNILTPAGFVRAAGRELPILSVTMRDGLVDQSDKFKKRIASYDISNYRVVHENELVVGFPIDEGVLGFQTKYPAAVVSPAYSIWKLKDPKKTHIPFIQRYLRSDEARAVYASKMRGGVARRRTLSREVFLAIEIPFPSLDEQKRIAALLDKADALCHQREKSLKLTEKLIHSVFIDMFGDPTTNPKKWNVVKSATLFADKPRLGTMKPADNVGYLVVRVGELGEERINFEECKRVDLGEIELKRFTLRPGDTLIARAIGSKSQLGKSSYFDGHPEIVVIDSHVMRLRPDPDKCHPYWFYFLLSAPFGRKLIQEKGGATAVQFNINGEQASDLDIPLPPIHLQKQFIEKATYIRKLYKLSNESLLKAQNLFSSLQQRAFRGELDLRRVMTDDEAEALIAAADKAYTLLNTTMPKLFGPKYISEAFRPPASHNKQFSKSDDVVKKGESIPWSPDYFRYRILGTMTAPFGFLELFQRAQRIFDEINYEEIKDLFDELLGHKRGTRALLEQSFSRRNGKGEKRMLFKPVATS